MKKIVFVLSCLLVLIFCGIGEAQIIDNLQAPLNNYVVPCNHLGTKDTCVENGKWHLGEDANASAGTDVYAIGYGTIKRAQTQAGYGGMYIIEHTLPTGEKVSALYAHMNIGSFVKSVGQIVYKGEYLGKIGNQSQNGGWGEHLHFGIRKGAYPSNSDAYICGDWIFSGYTACSSVLNNWYGPTPFIESNNYAISYQYDFPNHNSQGWATGYNTTVYQDPVDTNTFGVSITGSNPGIISPQYPPGLMAADIIAHFSIKQTNNNCSFLLGNIWVKDETGSWNNQVPLILANADYGYNNGVFKNQYYNLYRANFSVLRNNLEVRQFSVELTKGCGTNERWIMDWLKIYQKDPIVVASGSGSDPNPPPAPPTNLR
jgi:hypothetical protein